jgi:hypothetical protein
MLTETLAARAAASARMIGKACTIALLMAALGGLAVAGSNGHGNDNGNDNNQTVTAPEIDPGSAVAALALMSCGTLILTDRRRGR